MVNYDPICWVFRSPLRYRDLSPSSHISSRVNRQVTCHLETQLTVKVIFKWLHSSRGPNSDGLFWNVVVAMHQHQHYCDVTEYSTITTDVPWSCGSRSRKISTIYPINVQNADSFAHKCYEIYNNMSHIRISTVQTTNNDVRKTQDISGQQPKSLVI